MQETLSARRRALPPRKVDPLNTTEEDRDARDVETESLKWRRTCDSQNITNEIQAKAVYRLDYRL